MAVTIASTVRSLPTTNNSLIGTLSSAARARLAPSVRRVELAPGQSIMQRGSPVEQLFFPETGAVLVSVGIDGMRQPVGLVGCDGVIGWSRLLGTEMAHYDATVIIQPAVALAVRISEVEALAHVDPSIGNAILRFSQRFCLQTARSLASALRDRPERRIARLLLMLDDRLVDAEMHVTHNFIAEILNLRRATVTDSLHVLEGEHLLRCGRGRLQLRDRRGLEQVAAGSYGEVEALLPPTEVQRLADAG